MAGDALRRKLDASLDELVAAGGGSGGGGGRGGCGGSSSSSYRPVGRAGRPPIRERVEPYSAAGRPLSRFALGGGPPFQRGGRAARDDAPAGGSNCGVFVGNLPYSISWQDLKDHMRAAGHVVHCDILAEPGTTMGSKGCGLVKYATPAEARRAIRELSDTDLGGRPIFVREDREEEQEAPRGGGPVRASASFAPSPRAGSSSCSVFVGNVPYSVTWQELKDHMRAAGDVVHADIIAAPGTACGSKGCGLVTYASPAQARRAIRELTETLLKGRPIFVREDREEDRGEHEAPARRGGGPPPPWSAQDGRFSGSRAHGGGGGCRVFVGNLPYSADWRDLKDHMRAAGPVVHCDVLAAPGTTNGSKGCGLVEFRDAASARRATRELTDTEIHGRLIFVREDREE